MIYILKTFLGEYRMKKKVLTCILTAVCISFALVPQKVDAASWKHNNTGWWYQEDNGTYPKEKWKKIGADWYWFDTNGYMAVGWKKINNGWYYFKADGAMLGKGWHKIGSSYYYMYDTGTMAQNTWIGNEYVDANGVWIQGKTKYVQGWKKSGTRWWYCHKDGSYTKNGWEKINGKYYYFDASGYMLTGWKKANGVWYYLKSDGAMMNSGWLKIKEKWYYFREDGSMMGTGWHKINGNYYYMYSSGVMAADTWIDNYYVDISGARVTKKYSLNELSAMLKEYFSDPSWNKAYISAYSVSEGRFLNNTTAAFALRYASTNADFTHEANVLAGDVYINAYTLEGYISWFYGAEDTPISLKKK